MNAKAHTQEKAHAAPAVEPAKVETAVATIAAPAAGAATAVAAYDYSADGVTGFENVTEKMLVVPMLDILQSNSGEVVKETIPGAKAGMLIIRAFGEIFDGKEKGIQIVPCGNQEVLNEWIPIDAGGGLVAVHAPDSQMAKDAKAKQKFGKIKMANGHELVETHYLYALIVREDKTTTMVCIPFTSTKITSFKTLVTKAKGLMVAKPGGGQQGLPLFAHIYNLKTILKTKGTQSWYKFTDISWINGSALSARIDPRSDLYAQGRAMSQMVNDKLIKIDDKELQSTQTEGNSDADDGVDLATGASKEVPF